MKSLAGIDIENIENVKPGSLQAVVIAAGESEFNTLCDFEAKGKAFGVDSGLRGFLRAIYRRGLPIGAFGRAVPLLTKSIQGITDAGAVVTVGNDPRLQSGVEATGAQAITTRPGEVIIDESNKLVTCGGQLASNRLTEVAADCENMFTAIVELIKG
jgi:enhancing lycopene biosynthesis protein 2